VNDTRTPVVPAALAVSHDLSTQAGVPKVKFHIQTGFPVELATSQLS
jgi:hypothetical protein